MLYQICNGAVSFAANEILKNINFEIRSTEKIAVVGRNGCGKTTLLRLIAGEVELSKRDSDEDITISVTGNPKIGYLRQTAFEEETLSLEEEIKKVYRPVVDLMERAEAMIEVMDREPTQENIALYSSLHEQFLQMGGYDYARDYDIVLHKFGFTEEDKKKPLAEFSGGQRTKIALIKLLLSKPDILLLDEPTNHLDMEMVQWLEEYLKSYDRAVVLVSHDRMFLDRVADVVYEIEYKTAKRYPGNYSAFVERKRLNTEKQYKDYMLQQKEIERLTALVDRFKNKPTKVAMTRSKLKQIEHMEKIEMPERYDLRTFHAGFQPAKAGGGQVLLVNKLQIGYDRLLATVSFSVTRGKKIAVIGSNGTGKSTLLKTLIGAVPRLGGVYQYGYQIETGYFDQQVAEISSGKSVFDSFWDEFPELTPNEVRSSLGAFLFTQDEVFKSTSVLSGGEKARLALAKVLKRRPNFLLLDEPTNHMDIVGKETLEGMLQEYTGSVLLVSHDRYFIQRIADELLVFEEGGVTHYPYAYSRYLELQGVIAPAQPTESRDPPKQNAQSARQKEAPDKAEQRLQKHEKALTELEASIAQLKSEMDSPEVSTDYRKLLELSESLQEQEQRYNDLLTRVFGT